MITLRECKEEWRGVVLVFWKYMCDMLEYGLKSRKSSHSYRTTLVVEWSFSIGYTSGSRNYKHFREKHNISEIGKQNIGINRMDPLSKKGYSKKDQELFVIATIMFRFFKPLYFAKQYCIQFSKMNSAMEDTCVKKHKDKDISHQYMINLGKWTGAEIVCYFSTGEQIFSFDKPRHLLEFEGRHQHEVRLTKFQGVRYSVIGFQKWHEDKTVQDPILDAPSIIF